MSRLWSEHLYDADSGCVGSHNLSMFFLSDSRVILSRTFSEILCNVRNTKNVSFKHFLLVNDILTTLKGFFCFVLFFVFLCYWSLNSGTSP
jgi:hypothetical protein